MVGAGLTAAPHDILKALGVGGQVLVVSAPNIWKLHGKNWRGVAGKRGPVLIADGGKPRRSQPSRVSTTPSVTTASTGLPPSWHWRRRDR